MDAGWEAMDRSGRPSSRSAKLSRQVLSQRRGKVSPQRLRGEKSRDASGMET